MDITQLSGVSSDYLNTFAKKEALVPGDDDSFSAVLSTAMKSVDETNDLQNTAESEEVRFALGEDGFALMCRKIKYLWQKAGLREMRTCGSCETVGWMPF